MELIIKTDFTTLPQSVDFNFEAIKQELSVNLDKYQNLAVTEDSIKEAKADKAKLNRLITAFEDKRKEIKKSCLAPYEAFEKQVKELVGMIDAPVAAIDKQIKVYDEIAKTAKRENIERYYDANIGDLRDILPLDKIYNPRWENVTFDLMAATQELFKSIEQVKSDLVVIGAVEDKHQTYAKSVYLETLDLGKALSGVAKLKADEERIAAYTATVEPPKPVVVNPAPVAPKVEAPAPQERPQSQFEEPKQYDMRIWATSFQVEALRDFLVSNNIKYGKVSN